MSCAEVELDLSAELDRAEVECESTGPCLAEVVIGGAVIDQGDGEPIPKAQVTAFAEDGTVLAGPMAVDDDARYELPVRLEVDLDGAPVEVSAIVVGASAPAYHAIPDDDRPGLLVELDVPLAARIDDDRTTIRLDHKGNK